MKLLAALTLIIAASMTASIAQAETIIDTGPVTGTTKHSLSSGQSLAAQFTLSELTSINSIEGYIFALTPFSTVGITVTNDSADLPGASIFSSSFAPATSVESWQGIYGLNYLLDPGTYWVVFSNNFLGWMSGPSTTPLGKEAFLVPGEDIWKRADSIDVGVRVLGTSSRSAVPDAGSTLVLFTVGASIVFFARRLIPSRN